MGNFHSTLFSAKVKNSLVIRAVETAVEGACKSVHLGNHLDQLPFGGADANSLQNFTMIVQIF